MTDPYEVLGVGRSATMSEIKLAYRDLVKKYHPDNYHGSPLQTVAEEKMSQINHAFDQIKREREWEETATAGDAHTSGQSGWQGGATRHSSFSDIRQMVQQHRLEEAEALLQGVPHARRDAEWHFLQATVYFSRGWLNEAAAHFGIAHQMQPNNPEYRAAYQRMQWQSQGNFGAGNGQGQRNFHTGNAQSQCNVCNLCGGLMCLDCCCECTGGDLIGCC